MLSLFGRVVSAEHRVLKYTSEVHDVGTNIIHIKIYITVCMHSMNTQQHYATCGI